MTGQAAVGAMLDMVAADLSKGRIAAALQALQKHYPLPKGWVPAVVPNAPPSWSRERRVVQTYRNGILYAGDRDWFTQAGGALHIADQVNANPAGGQYVLRQSPSHTALVAPRPRRLLPERRPTVLIGSNANYSHWLLDYLPRIPLAQAQFPGLPLVLGAELADFERECLSGLGIALTSLHPVPRQATTHFDRLHIPDLGTVDRMPHPETVEWLRSTFVRRAGPGRRLWISRNTAPVRRVVNEDALLDTLAPQGFEKVVLEGRAIAERASLFAGAEIVVGAHGADFANAVFCRPGTMLVEIVPGPHAPAFFQALAGTTGLTYLRLQATPHPSPEQRQRQHPRNWDMAVDPAAIADAIKAI